MRVYFLNRIFLVLCIVLINSGFSKQHNKDIHTHTTDSCQQYTHIDFISAEEQMKRLPSLLYTFPGSGKYSDIHIDIRTY